MRHAHNLFIFMGGFYCVCVIVRVIFCIEYDLKNFLGWCVLNSHPYNGFTCCCYAMDGRALINRCDRFIKPFHIL